MMLVLLACAAGPSPESNRMELDGPCSPTPDWAGGWFGWPHFLDGGDLEGEGGLDLDLSSVDGVVTGTLVLSGDVTVMGVAIQPGHGWQVDVEGSSCWDDDAEENLTIRLASPAVETAAGWIETTAGVGYGHAWFPDGDEYEYVDVVQGPDMIPFFGGVS